MRNHRSALGAYKEHRQVNKSLCSEHMNNDIYSTSPPAHRARISVNSICISSKICQHSFKCHNKPLFFITFFKLQRSSNKYSPPRSYSLKVHNRRIKIYEKKKLGNRCILKIIYIYKISTYCNGTRTMQVGARGRSRIPANSDAWNSATRVI